MLGKVKGSRVEADSISLQVLVCKTSAGLVMIGLFGVTGELS